MRRLRGLQQWSSAAGPRPDWRGVACIFGRNRMVENQFGEARSTGCRKDAHRYATTLPGWTKSEIGSASTHTLNHNSRLSNRQMRLP